MNLRILRWVLVIKLQRKADLQKREALMKQAREARARRKETEGTIDDHLERARQALDRMSQIRF